MSIERLKSYHFNCPCCFQDHKRIFEYYAKYRGFISEEEPLPENEELTIIQRAIMDRDTLEGRSIPIGDGVFRCGNCYEFFKFVDNSSQPRELTQTEKTEAMQNFRPLVITKEQAIMNAVASLDLLLNKYGCYYNQETQSIVINTDSGSQFSFNIAEQLLDVFYKNNPIFDIKSSDYWAFEHKQE